LIYNEAHREKISNLSSNTAFEFLQRMSTGQITFCLLVAHTNNNNIDSNNLSFLLLSITWKTVLCIIKHNGQNLVFLQNHLSVYILT
jgi:hypothetical protein